MTTILHIADLHFGKEDPRLVESLVEEAGRLKPDVVVASGDLTTFGCRREFAQARDLFSRLDAPVVASPGNHDVPYALNGASTGRSARPDPSRRATSRAGWTAQPTTASCAWWSATTPLSRRAG